MTQREQSTKILIAMCVLHEQRYCERLVRQRKRRNASDGVDLIRQGQFSRNDEVYATRARRFLPTDRAIEPIHIRKGHGAQAQARGFGHDFGGL
jgi:hypothetical protein